MPPENTDPVPRTPDEPTTQQIHDAMTPGEPYTVSDFVERYDTSRWTIKRRLDELAEQGEIEKKKHAENRVTYWKQ